MFTLGGMIKMTKTTRAIVFCTAAVLLLVSAGALPALAQGPAAGPPPGVDGPSACTVGSTGWVKLRDTWTSTNTWGWIPGPNFWAQASSSTQEQAILSAVTSNHWILFQITSCPAGYGVFNVVRLWSY